MPSSKVLSVRGSTIKPEAKKSGVVVKPDSGFGRWVKSVEKDKELTHAAAHVFAVLSRMERGGIVSAGLRLIAERANMERNTAVVSIDLLVKRGHVEILSGGLRRRKVYRLTDPIFTQAIGVDGEVGKTKTAQKIKAPIADLVRCPRCSKSCLKLMKVGYCRGCGWADRVRRLAREEIAKSVPPIADSGIEKLA